MKKIDVVDEVAQLECRNDKFYALTYIYISQNSIQLELNFIIFLKCPKYFKKSGIWLKN